MNKLTGMVLAGGMLMGSQAATIEWTTSAITGYASDVVTNGTLLEAVNGVGGSVTTSPTVNGVTFTADGTLLANSWTGDPWDTTASDSEYDSLLSTIDYESSGTGPQTLKTFYGLTVGAEYVIQIWNAESSNVRTMTYDGSGNNVVDGLSYGIGTFTADETTQDLTVTASQNGPRLTAYQLRAVSGHVESDPIVDLSASNLNFSSTYVGFTNRMTLTVQNVGGKVLEGSASVSAPFYIESGAAYSLSNNQRQVVTVLFVPQAAGEVSELLLFSGGGGAAVSVSGTGEEEPEPLIGLSETNLSFVTTYVGATNRLTVTVRNDGGELLEGTASAAGPFAVVSGADYSLGLGEEQEVVVAFAPAADGDFSETLRFTGGGGADLPVSGTGKLLVGTVVADPASDYAAAAGYAAGTTAPSNTPAGWSYVYSDAAVGGHETNLTAQTVLGGGYGSGNSGFGGPSTYSTPAVLGGIAGGDAFEIFDNGNGGASAYPGHAAVVGTDLLLHPGADAATAYVIARYTFSEEDLLAGTEVDISGSFRDLCGGTTGAGADSITAEIYHNSTSLFSTNGTAGRLFEADGTFGISNLTVAAGDTISFVVGNNGELGGDETALTGTIFVPGAGVPVIEPGVEVADGNIAFSFSGTLGGHYQVQQTESLSVADWKTVYDVELLMESPKDVSMAVTNDAAFYRIIPVD